MPGPEGQTSAALPAPPLLATGRRRRRFLGRLEPALLCGAAGIGVLALAAWQVPPMLDWGRYKGVIETYVSGRLGRPVAIGGKVRLTLLPQPMLVAAAVMLPDPGDGISARVGAVRLEVSLWRLLAGHVVPRTLVLDNPVARLPWPLPRAAYYGTGLRPSLTRAFQATIEGGTLQIGQVVLRGLSAQIGTDADTAAFGAVGRASLAGRNWLFNALLDAPGRDGAAPLSLTLDGQPEGQGWRAPVGLQGTGGSFRGAALPDGRISGQLSFHGPDLSRLGAGPAVPWRVDGPVTTSPALVQAHGLALMLDGAAGRADLALRLAPPLSLDGRISLSAIVLGPWFWTAGPALPGVLSLSAGGVRLGDRPGVIRDASATLRSGPGGTRVEDGQAVLPGGGALRFSGALGGTGAFSGTASLDAADLRPALALAAPALASAWPPGAATAVSLSGGVKAQSGRLAISGLTGTAGGAAIGGSLGLDQGARNAVTADLTLDHLDLPAPRTLPSPATLARRFTGLDADLRLAVGQVTAGPLSLHGAVLDAHGGAEGLSLRRAAADLAGGHLELSGAAGASGVLSGARLDFTAPDAAALPAAWRWPRSLWRGPFHLALSGDGPPSGMAAQLRADLGDLRAEAEARLDLDAPRMQATITLRHPGAPRLLGAFGIADAYRWLDTGSFALLAHLDMAPGRLTARDIALSAAALRVGGMLDADLSGARPVVTGRLDADALALPAAPPPGAWAALRGWQGEIALTAGQVLAGLRPVAGKSDAVLHVADGTAVLRDVSAAWPGGGALTGALALDATQDPPALSVQASLSRAAIPDLEFGGGLGVSGGTLDGAADLFARGRDAAALLGNATGSLTATASNAGVTGVDLPRLSLLLRGRAPKRRDLQDALRSGGTGPLSGPVALDIAHGTVTVRALSLAGAAGRLAVTGSADLLGQTWNTRLAVLPSAAATPDLGLTLAGPWTAPRVTARSGPVRQPRARR